LSLPLVLVGRSLGTTPCDGSGDSLGVSVAEQESRYDDVADRHPSTILALNHEVYESTFSQTLPYAIDRLQSAGYRLVTVAECLGMKPYRSIGVPSSPTSDWQC